MLLNRSLSLGLLATSLLALGCAGDKAAAPGPASPAQPAPGVPGAPTAPGQLTMSDTPSSAPLTERPKMNESALAAYQAGMAAFQRGDLQTAKTQLVQATQADPKAFQAFYSLGVVRERLNEVQGALQAYRQATAIVGDEIEYAPDADFAGDDVFFYSVCDGRGACATAFVIVEVTAGDNAAPLDVAEDCLRHGAQMMGETEAVGRSAIAQRDAVLAEGKSGNAAVPAGTVQRIDDMAKLVDACEQRLDRPRLRRHQGVRKIGADMENGVHGHT